ncbi:MAG: hypothetical protein ACLFR7_08420 [Opitutales bacterium]
MRSFLAPTEEAPPPVPVAVPVVTTPASPATPLGIVARTPPVAAVEGARLQGTLEAPAEVSLGESFEVTMRASNSGEVALRDVLLWLPLPEGVHTTGGARYLRYRHPSLLPGDRIERVGVLVPTEPGLLSLAARFSSAQTPEQIARADLQLPTAVLQVTALPPDQLVPGSRSTLCFAVENLGNTAARNVWVRVVGGSVAPQGWRDLPAGERREVCFSLQAPAAGDWEVRVEASALAADTATALRTYHLEP